MGSKLDELLNKKRTVVPVLDLSRNIPQNKDELKRLMDKVPEYKMRPIKVRPDEIKTKENDFSFKPSRKERKKLLKNNGERSVFYSYTDPIPAEMRNIVLNDLYSVPIDWKMLTTLRPKNKTDENYFGKMIEMGKMQLKTQARDKKVQTLNPDVRKFKNKTGVIETRILVCINCGQELCDGRSCLDFGHDRYVRVDIKLTKKPPLKSLNVGSGKNGKSGKQRSKSPQNSKSKIKKVNSIGKSSGLELKSRK